MPLRDHGRVRVLHPVRGHEDAEGVVVLAVESSRAQAHFRAMVPAHRRIRGIQANAQRVAAVTHRRGQDPRRVVAAQLPHAGVVEAPQVAGLE